jgi:ABC-type glycerol-3-phosphate transport system substrate-binding protein
MTVKGHIYGVEWFPGPILMYYNRNLLKQAGLNPDQPPQTWPEFEDAVMKICKLPKQGEAKIYGFALRSQRVPNSGQWAIPIIYGFGGDLTTDGEVKLDTPPTRRAMQFLQNAAKGGCVPEGISTADTRALFAKGQAGFIFEGPWGQGNFLRLSDNKMKVAPNGDAWVADMPKGPDGKRRTIANANVVSISSKSKEKQLAAEWMQWVTSDPAVVDMVFEATQLISSPRSDRMTSGLMGKDAHTQVFRGGMAYSNDIPLADARFEGIMGEFIPAIQNIMKGADITAELAQADRRIQRITSR